MTEHICDSDPPPRQAKLVTGVLVVAYLFMVVFALFRHFGHDELFTYYMGQSPTLSHLIEEIRLMDLNPPLSYLITRSWQQIFGISEFATRVPSALLFLLASLDL